MDCSQGTHLFTQTSSRRTLLSLHSCLLVCIIAKQAQYAIRQSVQPELVCKSNTTKPKAEWCSIYKPTRAVQTAVSHTGLFCFYRRTFLYKFLPFYTRRGVRHFVSALLFHPPRPVIHLSRRGQIRIKIQYKYHEIIFVLLSAIFFL